MKNMGVDEKAVIKGFHLLTTKPVMYIANVAEDGFENNPLLDVVKAIADEEGAIVVPVCNKIEAEIAELDDGEEKDMFLEALGLEEPGLNRVIRAGYEMLNLQTYFTAGVEEVRAWTVKVGATAPQAAGVIHTDFEKGFIRAEVIAYNDFIQYKGEAGTKEAVAQKALLEQLIVHFTLGKPARSLIKNMDADEKQIIKGFHLLTTKPVMYIANVAEDGFENNPLLDVVKAIAEEEGAIVVPVCNKIEAEIAELDDGEEKDMFLEALGLEEPGLNRVIRAGYEMLDLQTYFTAGVQEVRAWTVKVGATAPQAAGVIHTDFEKGFIRAEVIGYDDFIKYNGEAGAKEAGKWRLEGKDYIVKDGDVLHFRFNV